VERGGTTAKVKFVNQRIEIEVLVTCRGSVVAASVATDSLSSGPGSDGGSAPIGSETDH
jgi:hypothetical protein